MAYTPTTWVEGVTALGPTNLNHIETGVSDAHTTADGAVPKSAVDAKGDLLVATAADTVTRKAVGADNTVLIAASGQSDGLKWEKIGQENLDTTTRKAIPAATLTSSLVSNAWPDAASNYVDLIIAVPDNYVSGDISFKILRRAGGTGGTAVMQKSSFRFRDGAAITTIDSAVSVNLTPANTNSNVLTATITAANFQAGDVLRVQISRLGADGSDTLAQAVQFDGAWIEYTGYV